MAAHHRVHDHACCHLQADCLRVRDQLGPLRSAMSMGTFTFTFVLVSHQETRSVEQRRQYTVVKL